MNRREWKRFVHYMLREHVQPNLDANGFAERFARSNLEIQAMIVALEEAILLLRSIEHENSNHSAATHTEELVNEPLSTLEAATRLQSQLFVETGLANNLQEIYGVIAAGMRIEDFPQEDLSALRRAGFSDPRQELRLSIFRAQNAAYRLSRMPIGAISRRLRVLEEEVAELRVQLNARIPSPKRRRLFKGIGSLGKGTLLCILDGTLLAGCWPADIAPGTAMVGATVSLTAGFGDIMSGLGDLRGE